MKILTTTFVLLALASFSWSQTMTSPEEVIARIIDSGFLEGHDQKVIAGMGDAAAVIVTKIVRDRNLTPTQIDCVLIVLNSAFGDMDSGPDREPKTALFVLRCLETTTQDTSLLQRIDKTRKYIQGHTSPNAKNP